LLITRDDDETCTVEFDWVDDDPARPAHDVVVRLIGATDYAYDDGDLSAYLMDWGDDGVWRLSLRLPSAVRTSYQFCPVRDQALRGTAAPDEERWAAIVSGGRPDPGQGAGIGPSTWPNHGSASVLSLPDAPTQPWLEPRDVPRGTVTRHTLGASSLWVYAPVSTQDACLAILFDGEIWDGIGITPVFDNLIAAGAIPPTVFVGIDSIHEMPRNEALTRPSVLEPFLLEEVLPFVHNGWSVTGDPARTVVAGQSLGGLAAAQIGLDHPGRFGRILTQSGSFWRTASGPGEIDAPTLLDAYAATPRVPLRFFQEAGSLERTLLLRNRIFHGLLLDRGYPVTYREYAGGHDYACWRGGLADGLIDLLGL
jgi:enterochelin esterase-like enzyme